MRLPIPTSLILPPLERCLGTSPRLKLQPAPLRQALAGEGRDGVRSHKILWHRDRSRLTAGPERRTPSCSQQCHRARARQGTLRSLALTGAPRVGCAVRRSGRSTGTRWRSNRARSF